MITLYQFSISHFCEKARWALDYKGIPYRTVNPLPGAHRKLIKSFAPSSQVPVLVEDENVIQGSAAIIDYLEANYPEPGLSLKNQARQSELQAMEYRLDHELGPALRRFFYHHMLQEPAKVVPLLTHNTVWYGSLVFRLKYKKIEQLMREGMNIDATTAAQSLELVRREVGKLANHYQSCRFLFDERFSRADLTAAALLAPLVSHPKYGIPWPKSYPQDIARVVSELAPSLEWVDRMYRDHRPKRTGS